MVRPPDVVPALGHGSLSGQAASSGDVLEVDSVVARAPRPLLVRFPSLRPALHSVRFRVFRQVRLPLLLVLDEGRLRVFAVCAQAKTLSVQGILRLLIGIRLSGKDEEN